LVLKRFSELVLTKVRLNLKAEASKSYLSYAWWILEPALFVMVFYVVFGIFLDRGTENFVVFLLCGQIPFLWFSRTVSNSCSSIEQGLSLMIQIRIPKLFFPLVVIAQDTIKSVCVFSLLFVFVFIYTGDIALSWLSLPIIMLVQLMFVSAISLLFAMVIPFVPDFKFLVATGIQLLMFGSGIFYSYEDVIKPEHLTWFLANPMANLISQYRSVLLDGQMPDWTALFLIFSISVFTLIVMAKLIKKFDSIYPRLLME
jgi:lipopolysaccharide transport system permease protein